MLHAPSALRSAFSTRLGPAVLSALIWCAAAAGIAYWVLRWPSQGTPAAQVPAVASPLAQAGLGSVGHVGKALGHAKVLTPAPESSKRFVLMGVIAKPSGRGSALIAIDGQAPKAFVVSQELAEGWTLKSITHQGVELQNAGTPLLLELSGYQKD